MSKSGSISRKRVKLGKDMTKREVERFAITIDSAPTSAADIEKIREAIADLSAFLGGDDETEWQQSVAPALNFARDSLKNSTKKKPYAPHADKEWFAEEIVHLENEVQYFLQHGNGIQVAIHALQLGALITECKMLINWEPTVQYGQRQNEDRKKGGKEFRKESPETYVKAWREQYKICGKRTEADRLAGEQLGVSESTVRYWRSKVQHS